MITKLINIKIEYIEIYTIKNPVENNNPYFQQKFINTSYRTLGSVARTHIIIKDTVNAFIIKNKFSRKKKPENSPQPDKNKIDKKKAMVKILRYSPKKKNAKGNAENSTLYPATNSASASGKSNGALFVSAKIQTNISSMFGNIIEKLEIPITICVLAITSKLNELEIKKIGSNITAIVNSYEIIWITARIEPITAYLLRLENPEIKIE